MSKGPYSLKFILLGLLTFTPATGYDLKKMMDRSIRFISPVALSQIYPTLRQMTDDGWVRFEDVARSRKPDLKIYSLTETGIQQFKAWLAEPYEPDPYRFDYFTLRFSFSSMLDNATLRTFVQRELEYRRAQWEATQEFDMQNLGDLDPIDALDMGRTTRFWGLYHQYGMSFIQSYISWLEDVLQELKKDSE